MIFLQIFHVLMKKKKSQSVKAEIGVQDGSVHPMSDLKRLKATHVRVVPPQNYQTALNKDSFIFSFVFFCFKENYCLILELKREKNQDGVFVGFQQIKRIERKKVSGKYKLQLWYYL